MSTETTTESASDSAAPEGQNSQPEPKDAGLAHQQNDAADGADQSQEPEDKADSLTPEQRTIRKLESRIARLTGKRGAAEREAELLRQEVERLRPRQAESRQGQDDESGEQKLTRADVERQANERAAELLRQRSIGERVGKVLEAGKKLEGFSAATDAVAEIVPFTDRKGQPTPFIEAVLDADDPAAVLKYLGDNPDEAEDLADLTPAQLGRRLAKLEDRLKQSAKQQTSAAPKPLRPVDSRSVADNSPRDNDSIDDWMRKERERIAAQRRRA